MMSLKKLGILPASWLTLFFFTASEVFGAGAAWAALPAFTPPAAEVNTAKNLFSPVLPSSLGTLTESSPGSGPLLVHLQTAHGNAEAQQNIALILRFLKHTYGIDTVFVEGTAGALTPDILRLVPERVDKTMAVAEGLARRGLVKGADLFLIGDPKARGQGIEDLELYRQNREAFKTVLREQQFSRNFIGELHQRLERLISPYLNRDLRHFLQRRDDYQEGHLPYPEWIHFLKNEAARLSVADLSHAREQLDWPMLVRLFKLDELHEGLDPAALEREKTDFLAALREFGISAALEREAQRLLGPGSVRRSEPGPADGRSAEALAEALPANFPYKNFPNLNRYLGFLILHGEMDAAVLGRETEKLEQQVAAALCASDAEKSIVELVYRRMLLEKLLALELLPPDFSRLVSAEEDYRPSRLAEAFRAADRDGLAEKDSWPPLEALDRLFEKAMNFYRLARERDQVMAVRLDRMIREQGLQKAAVVTGGFHAGPFSDYFRAQGYRYSQGMPSITEVDETGDRSVYLRSLFQNESPAASATLETSSPLLSPESIAAHGSDARFERNEVFREIASFNAGASAPLTAEELSRSAHRRVFGYEVPGVLDETGIPALLKSELRVVEATAKETVLQGTGPLTLAVRLGGTRLSMALVDENSTAWEFFPLRPWREAFGLTRQFSDSVPLAERIAEQAAQALREFRTQQGAPQGNPERLVKVRFAVPGPLEKKKSGTILGVKGSSEALPFRDYVLEDDFRRVLTEAFASDEPMAGHLGKVAVEVVTQAEAELESIRREGGTLDGRPDAALILAGAGLEIAMVEGGQPVTGVGVKEAGADEFREPGLLGRHLVYIPDAASPLGYRYQYRGFPRGQGFAVTERLKGEMLSPGRLGRQMLAKRMAADLRKHAETPEGAPLLAAFGFENVAALDAYIDSQDEALTYPLHDRIFKGLTEAARGGDLWAREQIEAVAREFGTAIAAAIAFYKDHEFSKNIAFDFWPGDGIGAGVQGERGEDFFLHTLRVAVDYALMAQHEFNESDAERHAKIFPVPVDPKAAYTAFIPKRSAASSKPKARYTDAQIEEAYDAAEATVQIMGRPGQLPSLKVFGENLPVASAPNRTKLIEIVKDYNLRHPDKVMRFEGVKDADIGITPQPLPKPVPPPAPARPPVPPEAFAAAEKAVLATRRQALEQIHQKADSLEQGGEVFARERREAVLKAAAEQKIFFETRTEQILDEASDAEARARVEVLVPKARADWEIFSNEHQDVFEQGLRGIRSGVAALSSRLRRPFGMTVLPEADRRRIHSAPSVAALDTLAAQMRTEIEEQARDALRQLDLFGAGETSRHDAAAFEKLLKEEAANRLRSLESMRDSGLSEEQEALFRPKTWTALQPLDETEKAALPVLDWSAKGITDQKVESIKQAVRLLKEKNKRAFIPLKLVAQALNLPQVRLSTFFGRTYTSETMLDLGILPESWTVRATFEAAVGAVLGDMRRSEHEIIMRAEFINYLGRADASFLKTVQGALETDNAPKALAEVYGLFPKYDLPEEALARREWARKFLEENNLPPTPALLERAMHITPRGEGFVIEKPSFEAVSAFAKEYGDGHEGAAPAVQDLAEHFKLSRPTISKMLRDFAADGKEIQTRRGAELSDTARKSIGEILARLQLKSSAGDLSFLEETGQLVESLEQVRGQYGVRSLARKAKADLETAVTAYQEQTPLQEESSRQLVDFRRRLSRLIRAPAGGENKSELRTSFESKPLMIEPSQVLTRYGKDQLPDGSDGSLLTPTFLAGINEGWVLVGHGDRYDSSLRLLHLEEDRMHPEMQYRLRADPLFQEDKQFFDMPVFFSFLPSVSQNLQDIFTFSGHSGDYEAFRLNLKSVKKGLQAEKIKSLAPVRNLGLRAHGVLYHPRARHFLTFHESADGDFYEGAVFRETFELSTSASASAIRGLYDPSPPVYDASHDWVLTLDVDEHNIYHMRAYRWRPHPQGGNRGGYEKAGAAELPRPGGREFHTRVNLFQMAVIHRKSGVLYLVTDAANQALYVLEPQFQGEGQKAELTGLRLHDLINLEKVIPLDRRQVEREDFTIPVLVQPVSGRILLGDPRAQQILLLPSLETLSGGEATKLFLGFVTGLSKIDLYRFPKRKRAVLEWPLTFWPEPAPGGGLLLNTVERVGAARYEKLLTKEDLSAPAIPSKGWTARSGPQKDIPREGWTETAGVQHPDTRFAESGSWKIQASRSWSAAEGGRLEIETTGENGGPLRKTFRIPGYHPLQGYDVWTAVSEDGHVGILHVYPGGEMPTVWSGKAAVENNDLMLKSDLPDGQWRILPQEEKPRGLFFDPAGTLWTYAANPERERLVRVAAIAEAEPYQALLYDRPKSELRTYDSRRRADRDLSAAARHTMAYQKVSDHALRAKIGKRVAAVARGHVDSGDPARRISTAEIYQIWEEAKRDVASDFSVELADREDLRERLRAEQLYLFDAREFLKVTAALGIQLGIMLAAFVYHAERRLVFARLDFLAVSRETAYALLYHELLEAIKADHFNGSGWITDFKEGIIQHFTYRAMDARRKPYPVFDPKYEFMRLTANRLVQRGLEEKGLRQFLVGSLSRQELNRQLTRLLGAPGKGTRLEQIADLSFHNRLITLADVVSHASPDRAELRAGGLSRRDFFRASAAGLLTGLSILYESPRVVLAADKETGKVTLFLLSHGTAEDFESVKPHLDKILQELLAAGKKVHYFVEAAELSDELSLTALLYQNLREKEVLRKVFGAPDAGDIPENFLTGSFQKGFISTPMLEGLENQLKAMKDRGEVAKDEAEDYEAAIKLLPVLRGILKKFQALARSEDQPGRREALEAIAGIFADYYDAADASYAVRDLSKAPLPFRLYYAQSLDKDDQPRNFWSAQEKYLREGPLAPELGTRIFVHRERLLRPEQLDRYMRASAEYGWYFEVNIPDDPLAYFPALFPTHQERVYQNGGSGWKRVNRVRDAYYRILKRFDQAVMSSRDRNLTRDILKNTQGEGAAAVVTRGYAHEGLAMRLGARRNLATPETREMLTVQGLEMSLDHPPTTEAEFAQLASGRISLALQQKIDRYIAVGMLMDLVTMAHKDLAAAYQSRLKKAEENLDKNLTEEQRTEALAALRRTDPYFRNLDPAPLHEKLVSFLFTGYRNVRGSLIEKPEQAEAFLYQALKLQETYERVLKKSLQKKKPVSGAEDPAVLAGWAYASYLAMWKIKSASIPFPLEVEELPLRLLHRAVEEGIYEGDIQKFLDAFEAEAEKQMDYKPSLLRKERYSVDPVSPDRTELRSPELTREVILEALSRGGLTEDNLGSDARGFYVTVERGEYEKIDQLHAVTLALEAYKGPYEMEIKPMAAHGDYQLQIVRKTKSSAKRSTRRHRRRPELRSDELDQGDLFTKDEIDEVQRRIVYLKGGWPHWDLHAKEMLLEPSFLLMLLGIRPAYFRSTPREASPMKFFGAVTPKFNDLMMLALPPWGDLSPLAISIPQAARAVYENQDLLKDYGFIMDERYLAALHTFAGDPFSYEPQHVAAYLWELFDQAVKTEDKLDVFMGILSGYPSEDIREYVNTGGRILSQQNALQGVMNYRNTEFRKIFFWERKQGSPEAVRQSLRYRSALYHAYSEFRGLGGFRDIAAAIGLPESVHMAQVPRSLRPSELRSESLNVYTATMDDFFQRYFGDRRDLQLMDLGSEEPPLFARKFAGENPDRLSRAHALEYSWGQIRVRNAVEENSRPVESSEDLMTFLQRPEYAHQYDLVTVNAPQGRILEYFDEARVLLRPGGLLLLRLHRQNARLGETLEQRHAEWGWDLKVFPQGLRGYPDSRDNSAYDTLYVLSPRADSGSELRTIPAKEISGDGRGAETEPLLPAAYEALIRKADPRQGNRPFWQEKARKVERLKEILKGALQGTDPEKMDRQELLQRLQAIFPEITVLQRDIQNLISVIALFEDYDLGLQMYRSFHSIDAPDCGLCADSSKALVSALQELSEAGAEARVERIVEDATHLHSVAVVPTTEGVTAVDLAAGQIFFRPEGDLRVEPFEKYVRLVKDRSVGKGGVAPDQIEALRRRSREVQQEYDAYRWPARTLWNQRLKEADSDREAKRGEMRSVTPEIYLPLRTMIQLEVRREVTSKGPAPEFLFQKVNRSDFPFLASLPQDGRSVYIPHKPFEIVKEKPAASRNDFVVVYRRFQQRYAAVHVLDEKGTGLPVEKFLETVRGETAESYSEAKASGEYRYYAPMISDWGVIVEARGLAASLAGTGAKAAEEVRGKAFDYPAAEKRKENNTPAGLVYRVAVPSFKGVPAEETSLFAQVEVWSDDHKWLKYEDYVNYRKKRGRVPDGVDMRRYLTRRILVPRDKRPERSAEVNELNALAGGNEITGIMLMPGAGFEDPAEWWHNTSLKRDAHGNIVDFDVEKYLEPARLRIAPAHEGVDLFIVQNEYGGQVYVPPGTGVRALAAGRVAALVPDVMGDTVVVEHPGLSNEYGDRAYTVYSHVKSKVRAGDEVTEDMILAEIADPGPEWKGAPPHLHFSMMWIPADYEQTSGRPVKWDEYHKEFMPYNPFFSPFYLVNVEQDLPFKRVAVPQGLRLLERPESSWQNIAEGLTALLRPAYLEFVYGFRTEPSLLALAPQLSNPPGKTLNLIDAILETLERLGAEAVYARPMLLVLEGAINREHFIGRNFTGRIERILERAGQTGFPQPDAGKVLAGLEKINTVTDDSEVKAMTLELMGELGPLAGQNPIILSIEMGRHASLPARAGGAGIFHAVMALVDTVGRAEPPAEPFLSWLAGFADPLSYGPWFKHLHGAIQTQTEIAMSRLRGEKTEDAADRSLQRQVSRLIGLIRMSRVLFQEDPEKAGAIFGTYEHAVRSRLFQLGPQAIQAGPALAELEQVLSRTGYEGLAEYVRDLMRLTGFRLREAPEKMAGSFYIPDLEIQAQIFETGPADDADEVSIMVRVTGRKVEFISEASTVTHTFTASRSLWNAPAFSRLLEETLRSRLHLNEQGFLGISEFDDGTRALIKELGLAYKTDDMKTRTELRAQGDEAGVSRQLEWLDDTGAHQLAYQVLKTLHPGDVKGLSDEDQYTIHLHTYQHEKSDEFSVADDRDAVVERIGPLVFVVLSTADWQAVDDVRQKLTALYQQYPSNIFITTTPDHSKYLELGRYTSKMIAAMLEKGDDFKGAVVTDFGSGDGVLSRIALKAFQARRVLLLDYSPYELNVARQFLSREGFEQGLPSSGDFFTENVDLHRRPWNPVLGEIKGLTDIALLNMGPWLQYGNANGEVVEEVAGWPGIRLFLNGGYGYGFDGHEDALQEVSEQLRQAGFEVSFPDRRLFGPRSSATLLIAARPGFSRRAFLEDATGSSDVLELGGLRPARRDSRNELRVGEDTPEARYFIGRSKVRLRPGYFLRRPQYSIYREGAMERPTHPLSPDDQRAKVMLDAAMDYLWQIAMKYRDTDPKLALRVLALDEATTVIAKDLGTNFFFSNVGTKFGDPSRLSLRLRAIYLSKRLLDRLDPASPAAQAMVAVYLNRAQFILDLFHDAYEKGNTVQRIYKKISTAVADPDFKDKALILDGIPEAEIDAMLEPMILEDEVIRREAAALIPTRAREVVESANELEKELARVQAPVLSFADLPDRERFSQSAHELEDIGLQYQSVGKREKASVFYRRAQRMYRHTREVDPGGLLPFRVQEEAVDLLLRAGLLDEFYQEFSSLLTGEDMPSPLIAIEPEVLNSQREDYRLMWLPVWIRETVPKLLYTLQVYTTVYKAGPVRDHAEEILKQVQKQVAEYWNRRVLSIMARRGTFDKPWPEESKSLKGSAVIPFWNTWKELKFRWIANKEGNGRDVVLDAITFKRGDLFAENNLGSFEFRVEEGAAQADLKKLVRDSSTKEIYGGITDALLIIALRMAKANGAERFEIKAPESDSGVLENLGFLREEEEHWVYDHLQTRDLEDLPMLHLMQKFESEEEEQTGLERTSLGGASRKSSGLSEPEVRDELRAKEPEAPEALVRQYETRITLFQPLTEEDWQTLESAFSVRQLAMLGIRLAAELSTPQTIGRAELEARQKRLMASIRQKNLARSSTAEVPKAAPPSGLILPPDFDRRSELRELLTAAGVVLATAAAYGAWRLLEPFWFHWRVRRALRSAQLLDRGSYSFVFTHPKQFLRDVLIVRRDAVSIHRDLPTSVSLPQNPLRLEAAIYERLYPRGLVPSMRRAGEIAFDDVRAVEGSADALEKLRREKAHHGTGEIIVQRRGIPLDRFINERPESAETVRRELANFTRRLWQEGWIDLDLRLQNYMVAMDSRGRPRKHPEGGWVIQLHDLGSVQPLPESAGALEKFFTEPTVYDQYQRGMFFLRNLGKSQNVARLVFPEIDFEQGFQLIEEARKERKAGATPQISKQRYLASLRRENSQQVLSFYARRMAREIIRVRNETGRTEMREALPSSSDMTAFLQAVNRRWDAGERDLQPALDALKARWNPVLEEMMGDNTASWGPRLPHQVFVQRVVLSILEFDTVKLERYAKREYPEFGYDARILHKLEENQKAALEALEQFLDRVNRAFPEAYSLSLSQAVIEAFSGYFQSAEAVHKFMELQARLQYLPHYGAEVMGVHLFFTGVHLSHNLVDSDFADVMPLVAHVKQVIDLLKNPRRFEDRSPEERARLDWILKAGLLKFLWSVEPLLVADSELEKYIVEGYYGHASAKAVLWMRGIQEVAALRQMVQENLEAIDGWNEEIRLTNPDMAALYKMLNWYFYHRYAPGNLPAWHRADGRPVSLTDVLLDPDTAKNDAFLNQLPVGVHVVESGAFEYIPWSVFRNNERFVRYKQAEIHRFMEHLRPKLAALIRKSELRKSSEPLPGKAEIPETLSPESLRVLKFFRENILALAVVRAWGPARAAAFLSTVLGTPVYAREAGLAPAVIESLLPDHGQSRLVPAAAYPDLLAARLPASVETLRPGALVLDADWLGAFLKAPRALYLLLESVADLQKSFHSEEPLLAAAGEDSLYEAIEQALLRKNTLHWSERQAVKSRILPGLHRLFRVLPNDSAAFNAFAEASNHAAGTFFARETEREGLAGEAHFVLAPESVHQADLEAVALLLPALMMAAALIRDLGEPTEQIRVLRQALPPGFERQGQVFAVRLAAFVEYLQAQKAVEWAA